MDARNEVTTQWDLSDEELDRRDDMHKACWKSITAGNGASQAKQEPK